MRNLKNTEIADYVYEEITKKGFDKDYSYISQIVDDSITYNNDYEKDENGEISKELSEEEIKTLKENMLDGTLEYLEETM